MKMNEDRVFGAAFVAMLVLNFAWMGFCVWAIYQVVTWLIAK